MSWPVSSSRAARTPAADSSKVSRAARCGKSPGTGAPDGVSAYESPGIAPSTTSSPPSGATCSR